MMTLEQKNEKAYIRADYCDNPVLVYELMHLLESDPDWRMKSLVGYHLMRKFLDDDTFTPEQELEMEMYKGLCLQNTGTFLYVRCFPQVRWMPIHQPDII